MIELELFDRKVRVTTPLASVRTAPFLHLDKDQNLLLLKTSFPHLSDYIVNFIQAVNAMLVGVEDHVGIRAKLTSVLEDIRFTNGNAKEDSDFGRTLLLQALVVGSNSEFLEKKTQELYDYGLYLSNIFNQMLQRDYPGLATFHVELPLTSDGPSS